MSRAVLFTSIAAGVGLIGASYLRLCALVSAPQLTGIIPIVTPYIEVETADGVLAAMERLPEGRVTIVLHTLGGRVTACVIQRAAPRGGRPRLVIGRRPSDRGPAGRTPGRERGRARHCRAVTPAASGGAIAIGTLEAHLRPQGVARANAVLGMLHHVLGWAKHRGMAVTVPEISKVKAEKIESLRFCTPDQIDLLISAARAHSTYACAAKSRAPISTAPGDHSR